MDSSFILATYNVRVPCDPAPNDWPTRVSRCKEVIRRNKFDIFGLQEAVIGQITDLLAGTMYQYIGGGRDDFKQAGEHSCIFYDTTRFTLVNGGTFGLSEKPDVPGFRSWDSACPRIATWGLFQDKATEKKFIYYNTHLDHVSEEARIQGIRMLVRHAAKNATDLPLVITGDFNTNPGSPTYLAAAELLHDVKDISETKPAGPSCTWHNWGKCSPQEPPIDFIFVSDGFRVHSVRTDDERIDGLFGSDHHPLMSELSL